MIINIKKKIAFTKRAIKAIWFYKIEAAQRCEHCLEKDNSFGAKFICKECKTLYYDRA